MNNLINCLDCNGLLSENAKACPHCGSPRGKAIGMKGRNVAVAWLLFIGVVPLYYAWEFMTPQLMLVLVFSIVYAFIILIKNRNT